MPCPLQFSAAEVEQQQRDEELWAEGVEPIKNEEEREAWLKAWAFVDSE